MLKDIIESNSSEEAEEHKEQHEWIKARIEAEKLKQEFYREAIKAVIQYSLPVIAGAIYYWLQGHFKP